LLVNVQKSNQKKKATVLSKITQDSAGNREVHIAVPRTDKELENMAPEDYNMTTIGMGPITREQVEEELQDSVNNVRSMLKQEREARLKVEQDFNTLKHYIQQVMQPIQQKEATTIPPSILPQETVSQVENMRTSSQMMKGWIERTEEKAYTHLEEIVQVYDRVIKLKDRVQALLRSCAEFKPIKEQYMPQLKSLMEAPVEDLIHDKVIDRDTPHDFVTWYFSFHNKGQLVDKIEVDMSRIRSVLLRTENHICTALTTICNPYGNVTIDNMKQQVKAFYFQYDGLDEGQLDSIFTLAYRLGENKSWIND